MQLFFFFLFLSFVFKNLANKVSSTEEILEKLVIESKSVTLTDEDSVPEITLNNIHYLQSSIRLKREYIGKASCWVVGFHEEELEKELNVDIKHEAIGFTIGYCYRQLCDRRFRTHLIHSTFPSYGYFEKSIQYQVQCKLVDNKEPLDKFTKNVKIIIPPINSYIKSISFADRATIISKFESFKTSEKMQKLDIPNELAHNLTIYLNFITRKNPSSVKIHAVLPKKSIQENLLTQKFELVSVQPLDFDIKIDYEDQCENDLCLIIENFFEVKVKNSPENFYAIHVDPFNPINLRLQNLPSNENYYCHVSLTEDSNLNNKAVQNLAFCDQSTCTTDMRIQFASNHIYASWNDLYSKKFKMNMLCRFLSGNKEINVPVQFHSLYDLSNQKFLKKSVAQAFLANTLRFLWGNERLSAF
ncbi:hypothetical protein HMI54_008936, partial [Coelomomyces lativittatus]